MNNPLTLIRENKLQILNSERIMYEKLIKRTEKAIVFLKEKEQLTEEESHPLWPITHNKLISKTMAGIADLMTEFAQQQVNDFKTSHGQALHKHFVTTRFSFINFMLGFMVGGIFCLAILYILL